MKNFLFVFFLGINSYFSNAQSYSIKDLEGCWRLTEMKNEEGVSLPINDLNSPGQLISCFQSDGKFISKVITDGTINVLGTGKYSVLTDGKTIRHERDSEQTADAVAEIDMDVEIVSLNETILEVVGDGIFMIFHKQK